MASDGPNDEPRPAWEALAAVLTAEAGPTGRNRERLCEAVCRVVVERFGFSRALIATLDRKRDRLITRAGYDPSIGAHVARALTRLFTIPLEPRRDGKLLAAAWCVLEDEQVHVPDASDYTFRPDRTTQRTTLIRAFGTKGYALTPIRGAREPIGVLAVDRVREGRPMGGEELRRLRTVAGLVGLALEAADGTGGRRGGAPSEPPPPEAGPRRSRAERAERTAQMQAVLDSLHEAVLVLGSAGDVRYLNRAAAALLEMLPWEAVGRPWREVVPLDEPEAFEELVTTGGASPRALPRRWTLRRSDGEPVLLRSEVLPLASVHAGRGTVVFLEDVTEGVEEERVRDEFLSMLVHDLSAPLQSVLGFAELLLMGRGGELTETQRDFIDRIQGSGRFMARLVEDILEVTELESGRALLEPERLEAEELVREVVDGLGGMAERASVELTSRLPPDLPPLRADRIRMRQALQNLVTNAIEASAPGSRVRIRGEAWRQDGTPWLRLQVVDAGVGLDDGAAAHLFDKYRSYGSGKRGGRRSRGLGLPIARLVVEAHGGRIAAEGRPGAGTVVTIELPFAGADEESEDGSAGRERADETT